MFGSYRALFARPGTAAFCAAGAVMRIPIAVYPLGLVLLFSRLEGGKYGVAGLMTGIYIVAGGVGAPVMARLVDRLGQRRVMVPAAVVHVVAILALVVLVRAHAPTVVLGVAVAVMGVALMSIGSLVRARWSYVFGGGPQLNTAYSLESVIDEGIFVIGPLLASVIATVVDPTWALVAGAFFVTVGGFWLQGQTDTEPPVPVAGGARPVFAFRYRGMVLLTLVMAGMGAIFAGVEVTIAAFAGQHDARSSTGIVLAFFALGSGLSGLLYGTAAVEQAVVEPAAAERVHLHGAAAAVPAGGHHSVARSRLARHRFRHRADVDRRVRAGRPAGAAGCAHRRTDLAAHRVELRLRIGRLPSSAAWPIPTAPGRPS